MSLIKSLSEPSFRKEEGQAGLVDSLFKGTLRESFTALIEIKELAVNPIHHPGPSLFKI